MALKVVISHKTHYKFDRPINLAPHVFRLRPAPHSRTPIEAYSIKIKPEDNFFNWQQDPFGNYQARLVFPNKTKELSVDVEIIADMKTINPFDFFVEDYAEHFPFEYPEALKKELVPYLEVTDQGKSLDKWLKSVDMTPRKTIDFLCDLNRLVYQYLNYTIRMEPGVQTCDQTLKKKLGSCRDFSWLLVQALRRLGFGARFVSGYLVQLKSDEESLDGPSGPAEDFTDLHAWTEVYIPGAGWVGFDSTSGLLAGEGHIPLACTPHYESAAPVTGAMDKCEVEFHHSNTVKRIFESPRVTKPYTEEQWDKIYNLGFQVEKELEEGDVRLTMGGEPTFVSIDDMESEQWNTDADGEHKRDRAAELSERLLNRFGKGGMLHHAQGKWYPGEPLPRWQVGIFWRKDGKPIFKNPKYLATFRNSYKLSPNAPKLFLKVLCDYLHTSKKNIMPAYEDTFYKLWEEGNVPSDVDPTKLNLKDSLERQRLADLLINGIEKPVGFVIPINYSLGQWISTPWEFRRNHLFLLPGTSPIGLRLPLDKLLVTPEFEFGPVFQPDLFAPTAKLIDYHARLTKGLKKKPKDAYNGGLKPFVRTALSAEIRESRLHLFMPPLDSIEPYLELIAAIELTAKKLNIPVIIEGYEPPRDRRVEVLKVTPDPGVVEINIHPANNWQELTDNTFALYEEARLSRLGTEKFMLDGKHTGTGGGNHVTLGGVTPSDSPLLRRPDLLRSLITFWQHHPSLSYLFSGSFIGPTSQAPRIDESRLERLYEMEIAFSQIPEDQEVPFWLTDRLFRHLLTDLTGNTHRSEFCIDKLYSPDSSSGRLGILELRGFDMPPHAQMSLTQMLLVRTLVAWFWKKPYKHKLVRWGTDLHDKFLLEHYVKEDIKDIVEQLNEAGYAFEVDWFDPFFEFRFPLYGLVKIKDIDVEIRMAVEPWNVLGEEMTGQGTARYVDSSLERVQIKLNNFTDERYIVTCNGVKVPLRATGKHGEFVSGVRFKAWQPWSALHPTIGVDAPLVFDIVDKWNGRSIGGCTYFVSHPGGLSYESYPINGLEAESRRINRFWDIGHSQGEVRTVTTPMAIPNIKRVVEQSRSDKIFQIQDNPVHMEFPTTLDLRKKWN